MLMKRGLDQGCFPDPDKSLFISDTPGQEEAVKQEFAIEGLTLNFASGSRYLGAVNPANVGDPGSATGYGDMEKQDGRDPELGDETLQRALPAHGTREAGDKGRGPPNGHARLTRAAAKGWNKGGTPHPAARAPTSQRGTGRGPPKHGRAGPPPRG